MRAAPTLLLLLLLATAGAGWLWWRAGDGVTPPALPAAPGAPDPAAVAAATTAPAVGHAHGERAPATAAGADRDRPDAEPALPAGDELLARGIVVDARSQTPLADAEVACAKRPRAVTRTDNDGRFELPLPFDGGGAELTASHAGHLPVRVTIRPGDVCERTAELRIELPPAELAGTLRGVAVDPDRRPLAGCTVRLAFQTRWPGPANPTDAVLPPVATDQDGRFVLAPLPPGRHDVELEAAGHDSWRRNGIALAAGETVDLGTIELRRFGWARVHGRIVDTHGEPAAGTVVTAETRHVSREPRTTTSDADGRYVLDRIAPGGVVLTFERAGTWSASRSIELAARDDSVQDVRIPLGAHFVGGEVFAGGRPADGFDVECHLPAATLAAAGLDALQLAAVVGSDGRFRVDGLTGGPVELFFTNRRPWLSEAVENVAVDRVDHHFAFAAKTGTLTVLGSVRTAAGRPIAGVVIGPIEAHPATARGITAADGSYGLTLAASAHSGIVLRATHPDFLPATQVLAPASADETRTLDFVLTAHADTGSVTVRVLGDGGPVARARVIVRTVDRRAMASGDTDDLGVWQEPLGAGAWQLDVRHPGFEPHRSTFELTPRTPHEVTVELAPRARHERIVEVRTAPDVPLPGVTVTAWHDGAFVTDARTDELGRARLRRLPAGDVDVSAEPAGHARHELRVRVDGDDETPVVFRVQPGLLSIDGQVLHADGRPASWAEVHCEPRDGGGGVRAFVAADENGRFTFQSLPAGDYTLRAWFGREPQRVDATAGAAPVVIRAR